MLDESSANVNSRLTVSSRQGILDDSVTEAPPELETLRGLVLSSAEPEPLARLRRAVGVALELEHTGDRLVDGFVADARDAGRSWSQIGAALGVTKQGAQQRFADRRPGPGYLGKRARELMAVAVEEARGLGHSYTGTEHLLLALTRADDLIASHALAALGITPDGVHAKIEQIAGVHEPRQWDCLGVRPHLKQALELALPEARRLGHSRIASEHLLLGIVRVEDSLAVEILRGLGAEPAQVRAQLADMLGVPVRELESKPRRLAGSRTSVRLR